MGWGVQSQGLLGWPRTRLGLVGSRPDPPALDFWRKKNKGTPFLEETNKLGGRFGYFFFFSVRGGGRGVRGARRGGIGFLFKVPGGGGGFPGGGGAEGPGGCLQ